MTSLCSDAVVTALSVAKTTSDESLMFGWLLGDVQLFKKVLSQENCSYATATVRRQQSLNCQSIGVQDIYNCWILGEY